MGIPLYVIREINRLIDDFRMHDFYDSFLSIDKKPSFRVLGGRFIKYRFEGSLFYTKTWEPLRRAIQKYGDDGWRAFFLHIYLDLIERNLRSGKGFLVLSIETFDYYKDYIKEVDSFIQENKNAIIYDIELYIRKKRPLSQK